jgi:formylglycine-generating enzyme required for sulfatase activity
MNRHVSLLGFLAVLLNCHALWSVADDSAISVDSEDRRPPALQFRGVTPGRTKESRLLEHAQWGQPTKRDSLPNHVSLFRYKLSGFEMNVALQEGVVRSIDVVMPAGVSVEDAKRVFGLNDPLPSRPLPRAAEIGETVAPGWKAMQFASGRAVLFVAEVDGVPQVKRVRFYGPPAGRGPLPKRLANSIGMELVLIPDGEFVMGDDDQKRTSPAHRVRITRPFYIGTTEVTQEQYKRVTGENPSSLSASGMYREKVVGIDTSRFPVETVSWNDAVAFCEKLSELEGREYRLPTEAEWEYACRAGSTTKWCFGNAEARLQDYGWVNTDPIGEIQVETLTAHPVAEKKPNAWGLYDMHGNVFEWVADWSSDEYYRTAPQDDPQGPESGKFRVLRGGCHVFGAAHTCSASRFGAAPDAQLAGSGGFRVVWAPD